MQCGEPASGPAGYGMRCVSVTEGQSLAVIRIDPTRIAQEATLTACLRDIAGVLHSQVDFPRGVIQVLYDGRKETVQDIHRIVTLMDWKE